MASLSALDYTSNLQQTSPPEHHVDFAVGEWSARLRTNSEELVGLLAKYLRHFVAPAEHPCVTITAHETAVPEFPKAFEDWKRDPGKSGQKEQVCDIEGGWLVRKVRTGMHYVLGSNQRTLVGPCVKNYIQVVNFINVEYMAWLMRKDWLLCHAAGICNASGQGLGLAGVSGAGKSTLALHLMNAGTHFVSNDRLLIGPGAPLQMSGVPKHPRINPGTALHNERLVGILPEERLTELRSMEREDLWQLEEKYDADIGEHYQGRWKITADILGVVLLNWHRNDTGPVAIREIDFAAREDLWPTILKTPGPLWVGPNEQRSPNTPTADPQDYLQVMASLPVYEVTGGINFEKAVGLCLGMIS
jgi:HprK-related kinase B